MSKRQREDGLPMSNVHPQKKSHPWARSPACTTLKAFKLDTFNERKIVPPKQTP
jgi:hypothetical protein